MSIFSQVGKYTSLNDIRSKLGKLRSCVKIKFTSIKPVWVYCSFKLVKNKITASPGHKSGLKLGTVVSCKGIRCQSFIDRAISVQTQNRWRKTVGQSSALTLACQISIRTYFWTSSTMFYVFVWRWKNLAFLDVTTLRVTEESIGKLFRNIFSYIQPSRTGLQTSLTITFVLWLIQNIYQKHTDCVVL